MKPGTIGYFPEGAYYGPQGPDDGRHLYGDPAVRWAERLGPADPGTNGGREERASQSRQLREGRVPPQSGRSRTEGTWTALKPFGKQINGRKLVYPEPQYAAPVMMYPDHFSGCRSPASAGVEEKLLGVFTDCQIPCALYRVHPGATFTAHGRGIFMVMSGRGARGENFRKYTSVYLDTGETTSFEADRGVRDPADGDAGCRSHSDALACRSRERGSRPRVRCL